MSFSTFIQELKECENRVYVDGPIELLPPHSNIVDLSSIDTILLSNHACMLALPFITEETGFQGRVYATEPTLQIGRYYQHQSFHFKNFLNTIIQLVSGYKQTIHGRASPLFGENTKKPKIKQVEADCQVFTSTTLQCSKTSRLEKDLLYESHQ